MSLFFLSNLGNAVMFVLAAQKKKGVWNQTQGPGQVALISSQTDKLSKKYCKNIVHEENKKNLPKINGNRFRRRRRRREKEQV